jgi:hypothetical protein
MREKATPVIVQGYDTEGLFREGEHELFISVGYQYDGVGGQSATLTIQKVDGTSRKHHSPPLVILFDEMQWQVFKQQIQYYHPFPEAELIDVEDDE